MILTVTGPMDRLQVTHRSDPPLQFSEIVALLATGKAPTSDPALLARQPAEPQQSWQQMGASYLGQAMANPVSGRLQRLFGVTKLKIDPQLSGVENNPQARLTLEQQVTRDLTFTYIQNVSEANPLVVRIEWAFSREWSAVAVREENGRLGVGLFLGLEDRDRARKQAPRRRSGQCHSRDVLGRLKLDVGDALPLSLARRRDQLQKEAQRQRQQ